MLRILVGVLAWIVGISIIGVSGVHLLTGLSNLLFGMPLLFIVDASYISIATISSLFTLITILWIVSPKLNRNNKNS